MNFHADVPALSSVSPGFISNMSVHRQYFPGDEDETGAAKALMRLQDTYQLDSEAFSRGKLPGNRRPNRNTQKGINEGERNAKSTILLQFYFKRLRFN